LSDDGLTEAICQFTIADITKQILLICHDEANIGWFWDFMITVIGSKYQLMDMSFGKIDLNTFFMRLQEQDDNVASWSDSTIKKLKQVLTKMLVE